MIVGNGDEKRYGRMYNWLVRIEEGIEYGNVSIGDDEDDEDEEYGDGYIIRR